MYMHLCRINETNCSVKTVTSMMLLTPNEASFGAGESFGSVVAVNVFDLCLSTHKTSYEKAMTIRVCRCSLPVGTSTGF